MTPTMTPTLTTPLRRAAGSLMVVGLGATELTPLERAWLRLIRPGGIILFRRNIADAAQSRTLLSEATSACSPNPMRAVDIEGGTVDRMRDAVAPMPAAQTVARTGKPALMHQHGELIAREARAFGFNTILAPVLDLALPISAAVMATRAAADNPAAVTAYVRQFLAGLAAHNITGCAKHFPGLGGGTLDSHQATPTIDRTWQQLWQQDLVPYRELSRELPMVMVNHAAYPLTRGGDKPATASPFWITSVLTRKIGYRGLIFSDDLEMGGILNYLPIEEAAIAAILAGIHMVEICHSPELILRCYEALVHHTESSPAFRRLLLTRATQTQNLRAARYSAPEKPPLTPTQLTALRDKILRFRATVEAAKPA